MSLMINQNITSLNAWRNLNKTDRNMSSTMEKLSSGLRINKAADDPSGLVISEQMRAQVVGLKAAIKNSEKGISMIQTAEGALDKVHGLLDKMRGLALDSANSATADSNMLAANQAELDNIIDTITRISDNTQYGTKKLLDGTNAVTGTLTAGSTGATGVSGISFAAGQAPTELALSVVQTVGVNDFAGTNTSAVLNSQGTLAVGSYSLTVSGSLDTATKNDTAWTTAGNTAATVTAVDGTNTFYTGSAQAVYEFRADADSVADWSTATGTNFVMSVWKDGVDTGTNVTFDDTGVAAYSAADVSIQVTLTEEAGITAGDAFTVTMDPSSAAVALNDGTTDVGTASYNSTSALPASVDLGGADFDLSGIGFTGADQVDAFAVTSVDSFTAALGTGTAVAVTDSSTVALTDENGNSANVTFGTVAAGTDGSIGSFVDNSLVFQVGANQGQTVNIALQDVSADMLAVGVTQTNASGFANLSEITIGDAAHATDAIALIDHAIDQVSVIRGNLGAFQANTLEANLDSLRVSSENLQASESIIRDTDMAAEMADFTKYQIMLQAGTSMLAQANQIPNNLLTLLR